MKHSRDSSSADTAHPPKRHTSGTHLPDNVSPVATPSGSAALRKLNKQYQLNFHNDCNKALEQDAEVDLGPLFNSYRLKYLRLRGILQDQRSQSGQSGQDDSLSQSLPSNKHINRSPHCTSAVITHPLDPQVKAVMESEILREPAGKSDEQIMMSKIDAMVKRGKKLSASGGRTVTQIHSNIVVKTGQGLDLNEVAIMEHIHRVSKSFPSPQPLGSITYNGMTHLFMTFIEGTSLQELWPSLSADLKTSVRDQLNTILKNLRSLPLPSSQLGSGDPPRCKDVRRSVRCSSVPIHNEDDFNNFLLSTMKPRIAQTYKEFVRTTCLHSRHRIVMTHGDFHPRNILAELHDGHVKIKGIVDWEAGGSYPEYWEYVKSLNTMSSVEEDDWYHYLPVIGMGEYCNEWAMDLLLETLVT
ncbi:kinase-like protein [Mytilinidion resinicola]|uniref:Kinase-like protein n=1 Tax=Mytilinidion resinicola TaxID=574789 RepID=A0A6A6YW64_9PEZI|nr:kinase-like protein [Mytilinidion resinicola]KAF2812798.1 kinase-like protein [Mytilinidion resinicola]